MIVIPRKDGVKDIYVFLYDKDFEGCLTDYFTLTGYPNMIPRFALGAWWYKNDKYTPDDIVNIVTKFNENNIPLSVFLLGDYWHDNINNYSPIINLRGVSSFLYSNNIRLGVTINPTKDIVRNSGEYNLISRFFNGDKLNFVPLSNDKLNIYFNLFISNLMNMGVSLFSIDYNNPNCI